MARILWGTWNDYPKVQRDGRIYAQVGPRLYTEHAVDRMQPSGWRYRGSDGSPQPLGKPKQERRSVPPEFVEDAIARGAKGAPFLHEHSGELRRIHTLGDLQIVTTADDAIVITIIVRHV